jgi:F-type H+-transporting ATPase subunit b
MKKFFFEKIRNFMQKREDDIIKSYENAEKVNNEANKIKELYNKQMENIENERKEIIKTAKIKADAQAKDIINEAEAKAVLIIKHAEEDIKQQQKNSIEEMKQEIADLAIIAAEKIIEKQLNYNEQQLIIAKIIENAGKVKWQN